MKLGVHRRTQAAVYESRFEEGRNEALLLLPWVRRGGGITHALEAVGRALAGVRPLSVKGRRRSCHGDATVEVMKA